MATRSLPAMELGCPPVTRARTFLTLVGPVKSAVSPVLILKVLKLWKRFLPARLPRSALMLNFGPLSCCADLPSEPSVAICAWALAAASEMRPPTHQQRRRIVLLRVSETIFDPIKHQTPVGG